MVDAFIFKDSIRIGISYANITEDAITIMAKVGARG
jgi:hypothetical protein